jgi:hypothetical protein
MIHCRQSPLWYQLLTLGIAGSVTHCWTTLHSGFNVGLNRADAPLKGRAYEPAGLKVSGRNLSGPAIGYAFVSRLLTVYCCLSP